MNGSFTQSGGTNSTIVLNLNSGGSYTLSESGLLSAQTEILGNIGYATLFKPAERILLRMVSYWAILRMRRNLHARRRRCVDDCFKHRRIYLGVSSKGRFNWIGGTLNSSHFYVENNGTLAMGFDFNVASLLDGSLYHSTNPLTQIEGTLEITNGAVATQGGSSSISINALRVGSTSEAEPICFPTRHGSVR